jgi:hypothetical protein
VIAHFYGVFGTALLRIFSFAPRFLAKRFQLHALSSRKKGGVVRAPHKLQFFVELLYGGVCGAVPNTPSSVESFYFILFDRKRLQTTSETAGEALPNETIYIVYSFSLSSESIYVVVIIFP